MRPIERPGDPDPADGDGTAFDEPTAQGPHPQPQGGATGRLAATVERLRAQIRDAHAAADGRALIEIAKGVLIERLHCSPVKAERELIELARASKLSPLELAAEIINQAARDHVSHLVADFARRTGAADEQTGRDASLAVRLRTAESAALAAGDTQAVAESLLRHALTPLGATAAAVWTAERDGSLTLSGHAGFGDEEAARWRYVPPGVATVARKALELRDTVHLDSVAETPSIGYRRYPRGGRIALCAGIGGRIHGVLEIGWPHPLPALSPALERQLDALAELCAHTLESPARNEPYSSSGRPQPDASLAELVDLSDGLYDPALVLVPHLDAGSRLADFKIHHVNAHFQDPIGRPRGVLAGSLMLEAFPLAVGASALFDHLERTYATGEPIRVRRMTVTTLIDQIPLPIVTDVSITRHAESLLMIWRIEDEAARLASLLQHAQRLGRIGGFEESLETGEITWSSQLFTLYGRSPAEGPAPLSALATHVHPDDTDAISRFLRAVLHHHHSATTAFRMLRADGVARHIRVVAEPVLDPDGRLLAVRGAYQDISSQHWTEVALAATRERLADSERETAERNRLALQLQHAIMPPARRPLEAPGLRIAVRYRPAESESLVGGDWYDAFVLPSRLVLLCVGDIAGHGVDAATEMVVLRNALRGLAMTGAGPAQLLSWLNSVAFHLTDHVTATAVCALYDPATRLLRWARAGHFPPVLIGPEDSISLPLTKGILLGAVPEADYEESEIRLRQGETVLMFTDGLVEQRDTALQDSLENLLVHTRQPGDDLGQLLERLLIHANSDTDDDTCLIGVQVA